MHWQQPPQQQRPLQRDRHSSRDDHADDDGQPPTPSGRNEERGATKEDEVGSTPPLESVYVTRRSSRVSSCLGPHAASVSFSAAAAEVEVEVDSDGARHRSPPHPPAHAHRRPPQRGADNGGNGRHTPLQQRHALHRRQGEKTRQETGDAMSVAWCGAGACAREHAVITGVNDVPATL